MTIAEKFRLGDRLDAVRKEMQKICNDFNVSFEGKIEMTTNEENFNERSFVSRGFKYQPNNK